MAQHVPLYELAILLIVGDGVGPWAHDRHAALQHVNKLRHLVERSAAQERSQPSDTGVTSLGLGNVRTVLAYLHCSQLPDLHSFAIQAISSLLEQHRSW